MLSCWDICLCLAETTDGETPTAKQSSENFNTSDGAQSLATPKQIPESSFPLLEENTGQLSQVERGHLEVKLSSESQEIMKKYYDLFCGFCQSLSNRHFSLTELISYLRRLKAYDPVEDIPQEQQKSVFEEHMQQLKNATSVDDVLDVVEKYCSFFNYDIIECMIMEYGTDHDKLKLERYIEEFNQYAKRRIYECPSDLANIDEESVKLHMKMDSKYEGYSLKALKEFQVYLCRVLNVSVHVLMLCRLDKGCIELTFQIPSFIEDHIFPLSIHHMTELSALGVLSLSVGNNRIVLQDQQVCYIS